MKFTVLEQPMAGLALLQRSEISDKRGAFSRLFCLDQLHALGWTTNVAQSNISITAQVGSIRGLHYQLPPHAEIKLVTCISGAIFDVAVDLRLGSSTFGQSFGTLLNSDNRKSLLIPKGFAHGFQVVQGAATIIYFHSTTYQPEAENGVRWDDPDLAINWPLPAEALSDRDRSLPFFKTLGEGIKI